MTEIAASILSVEENATQVFYDLEVAGVDYFHIDVMDGEFVPRNTEEMMYEYASTLNQISNTPMDVHLMVTDVRGNIEKYAPLNPRIITFHYESCKSDEEVLEIISFIKDSGIKAGLSVKPGTEIEKVLKFLPKLHLVLVMTVEPGAGGQALIPEMLR